MNASPSKQSSAGRTAMIALLIAGLGITIAAGSIWWMSQPDASEVLAEAKKDLQKSRFSDAFSKAEQAIRLGADPSEGGIIAGEAALKLQKLNDAIRNFELVDDQSGLQSIAARLSAGSILLHSHKLGPAEDQLRRALALDDQNVAAHRLLSDTLGLQGRRWESIPHLKFIVSAGDFDLQNLCYLADTDRAVELTEEQLTAFIQSDDPRSLLGAARVAISYRNFERGNQLLRQCLAKQPDLVEAHARLGKMLLSGNQDSDLADWNAHLPPTADSHPEIWFVRSQWCLRKKQHEQTAACLKRALKLYPDHAASNHQFAQTLTLLGHAEQAKGFADRSVKLTRLATLANDVYNGDLRSKKLRETAEIMEALERIPEAKGWTIAARHEQPQESWPFAMERRLQQKEEFESGEEHETAVSQVLKSPALSDLNIAWIPPAGKTPSTNARVPDNSSTSTVSFADATDAAGLKFRYRNGEDLTTEGRLMFEYTGGGTGVLDLDSDDWPDLFFTQAGDAQPFKNQTTHQDALLRNRLGQFSDVSIIAGIQDFGFGQGIATGDFNNDGFEDIYIGNIDGNQLYMNMGDGTFENVSAESGIGHEFWSTSVAIADLNSDAIPDLYDVTFLGEDDVFTRICEEDGVKRSCAPAGFQAADDVLYQGTGDGAFTDVSETAGIHVPDGDGLGILIADFAGSGSPDVFIANDGRANFFFRRNADAKSGQLKYQELALASGLAFDRDGRAQACMGIASSDFDGDGQYDLFVTNFYNESNTLYSQYGNAVFGDNSQQAGLREASMSMLAFGTQAIDADLDGFEDLLVANGHVDNFEYKDIPYRMPLECFRNSGQSSFNRLNPETLGPVFSQPMLGRSMAILDWNRDGKAEVAISRLEDPALLLECTTSQPGNRVSIRLEGIRSTRDASTTQLTALVNGRKIVRHLTAGSGYLSSNQKQLIFGLADAVEIEELQIRWPSGLQQTIKHVPANDEYVVIEGESKAYSIPQ